MPVRDQDHDQEHHQHQEHGRDQRLDPGRDPAHDQRLDPGRDPTHDQRLDPGRLGRQFWRLWSSSTISAAGDGLRGTAIPLLAASATRDPRTVSLVAAAGFAPWPLLGLLGGAVADRFDRRTAMWLVDLARGALMTGFAVLVAVAGAPVAALVGLTFLLGTAETVFASASTALLPSLVRPAQLPAANSRLLTSTTIVGALLGPTLAGLLFAVATALPLALDAASFLAAAALVATLRRPPARTTTTGAGTGETALGRWSGLRAEIYQGLAWLWQQPLLRTLTATTAVLGGVSGTLVALLPLYARDVLGMGSTGYGVLFACYAAGSIVGALATSRLLRRRPPGPLLLTSVLAAVLVFAALGLSSSAVAAGAALVGLGVAVGLWTVTVNSLRQALVPNPLLGRVSSADRAAVLSLTTAGAILGGLAAHATGIPATMIGCAVVVTALVATVGRRLTTATAPAR